MVIHGLTVSCNYADMLSLGIERWVRGLDSLSAVTDTKDTDTHKLCERWAVRCHRTDAFYKQGSPFAKASAMNEARPLMPKGEWHVLFDSDIVPPADWRLQVERIGLRAGHFYGAVRHQAKDAGEAYATDLPLIPGDERCCGFFQMYHADDPRATDPFIEIKHAGVYDSMFARRWPGKRQIVLPLHVNHVGPINNWLGRGRDVEFAAMQAERKARGSWEHEQIQS